MTMPILTTAATVMCPHGGQATLTPTQTDARAGGSPTCLVTDQHPVAGCPFTVPPGKPQPCIVIRWLVGATQTRINGTPVLLQNSVGLCYSAEQIPQGPPVIVQIQQQAKGI